MYQHPLERLLIYTDKETKTEFNLPKEIWHELYTLFVTTKYDVLDDDIAAVDFFNEVFYELTFTYANEDAAELINSYLYYSNPLCPPIPELENPRTKDEIKAAEKYKNIHRNINGYILYFVWYILTKQKELPPSVEAFLAALDNLLENNWNFDFRASKFYDYADEHDSVFSLSFDMNPQLDINLLLRSTEEWKNATFDFDSIVVKNIVARFKKEDDRKAIIEEIRKHLKKDNLNLLHSNRKVSLVTHRKKADDALLDELLTNEILSETSSNKHVNTIIRGTFIDYILSDQQKVLNVLMLIANLGKSQMPLIIKSIKALIHLGYIRKDCFENIDDFVEKASEQFPGVNFDIANVRRQIDAGENPQEEEYRLAVKKIAENIELVL